MRGLSSCLVASLVAAASPAVAQDRPSPRIAITKADNDLDKLTIRGRPFFPLGYRRPGDVVPASTNPVRGGLLGIALFTRGAKIYADLLPYGARPGWRMSAGPVVSSEVGLDQLVDRRAAARGPTFAAGGYVGVARTGIFTGYHDSASFYLFCLRGVDNAAGRYVVTPALDYSTPLSRTLLVGVSLSVDYAAAAPALDAPTGWQDPDASVYAGVALEGDVDHGLLLVLAGGYGRMAGDFAASPVTRIVGRPDQFYVALGLGYNF